MGSTGVFIETENSLVLETENNEGKERRGDMKRVVTGTGIGGGAERGMKHRNRK
jgi:hypothetical protein